MLGHRSITTTERYGHLAGSSLDEAAKKTRGGEPEPAVGVIVAVDRDAGTITIAAKDKPMGKGMT